MFPCVMMRRETSKRTEEQSFRHSTITMSPFQHAVKGPQYYPNDTALCLGVRSVLRRL